MGKYVSFGRYNKNYKYIIFACFFNILANLICGDFNELFPSNEQKKLYMHTTVHKIFQYIGVFFFSCILYKIETKSNKKEIRSKRTSLFSTMRSNNEIILIFNESQDEIGNISNLSFIFIITVYVCIEFLAEIFYKLGLNIFNLWMFELLVISYINAKMFKLKIYRHQKLAIFFNSFICLLFRLTYFILSFSLEDKGNETHGKSLFEISKWYIILGLFIYIFIINIRAYSYTKIKWFIDLKYISETKLLIYIGFIGILISSILCIIETNIECSPKINFCKVSYTNSSSKHLDNFGVYYETISSLKNYEIIYEICLILFGMICSFFGFYYDILIIKYLTPVHIIFYGSIYYFINKIIGLFFIFYNKIKNNHFFNENENDEEQFYLFLFDLLGIFITIFGFLIYLEIIELGFCKLNYNLRKYIEKRRVEEIKNKDDKYKGFNEENEQNERERNSIFSELESSTF